MDAAEVEVKFQISIIPFCVNVTDFCQATFKQAFGNHLLSCIVCRLYYNSHFIIVTKFDMK